ncbi:MAG: NAD(P)/FAD-dependent oxidoreductase [Candidatus Gastranaerophilaceae bacterium]|jgi:thioredoxin reductase
MQNVIIVGAGPAGIACAVQLKRFGVECTVFEKNEIGGLVKNANLIENYLGFPFGISGIEYVELIEKQFKRHKINLVNDEILEVKFDKDVFKVISSKSGAYKAEYLVIATGTIPKKFRHAEFISASHNHGILNAVDGTLPCNSRFARKQEELQVQDDVKQYMSKKIFYEITDILEIENKIIAIVGAGDAAFDYALNLSKLNKIKIFNRSSKIKALPLLVNRVNQNKNIEYYENTTIKEINLDGGKLKINNNTLADYLVVAIGRMQNDRLLTEELKENPNLCMIGDVKNGLLRQTSIASADGLKAAMDIYERINKNRT